MRILIIGAALFGFAWWLTPPGPDVSGVPRIVDGDTFWIGETKIRVFGIDAPESSDPLGPSATAWLTERVKGRTITCHQRDTDRYGRMVAVCFDGRQDIAEEITTLGLARAYRRFSVDYVDEENSARQAGIGIWQTSARPVQVSADCQIKGNIGANGRIYHVPGGRGYAETKIDEANGERWFCSADEALAAGWRAPRG